MSNSLIKELIDRLDREYDKAQSVESKSILLYLSGLLKNNYVIREELLLEKYYIKGLMEGTDAIMLKNSPKTFEEIDKEINKELNKT